MTTTKPLSMMYGKQTTLPSPEVTLDQYFEELLEGERHLGPGVIKLFLPKLAAWH